MVPIHRTQDSRHVQHSLDKPRRPAMNTTATNTSTATKPLPKLACETVIILIGAKQAEFHVNRRLLCTASPFFRHQLQNHPCRNSYKPATLWLPGESATMFSLFVEWLHDQRNFRSHLDDSIATATATATATAHSEASTTTTKANQDIHWAIIRLHLFAAHLNLYSLQDLSMDAIQDLYLKCDWDVPPGLVIYLYTQCEAIASVRLRRWAVAMVAFSLTVSWHVKFHPQGRETSDPARFRALLDSMPEFASDYAVHVRKMKRSRLDLRLKNPQLRIPSNDLLNEKRVFGFRECSFHSHRASVGEGPCPHGVHVRRGSEIGFELDDLDANEDDVDVDVDVCEAEYVPTGLAPPRNRSIEQATPRPLFSHAEERVVGGESRLVSGTVGYDNGKRKPSVGRPAK